MPQSTEPEGVIKILWYFSTGKYDQLRKIEGCENLKDIPATKDLKSIVKLNDLIGFDHVITCEGNPTKAEISA